MEFTKIIRSAKSKSDWVIWLSTDTGKAATETLSFLSVCYSNIPITKREDVRKRLLVGDRDEIEAIIRELVAFELLRRLHLIPDWSPKIEGKNPDLLFIANGEKFIADVFLVKSPKKTISKIDDIHTEYWDKPQSQSESRSNKIAEIIKRKSNHYSQLEYPLVLFVFFADNLGLDIQKVESALYGITVEEIQEDDVYPDDKTHHLSCPNLSAVIACKWFDTMNRSDEGKRLQCVVLHNWVTNTKLPVNAFLPFGQIIWTTTGNNNHPYYESNLNMVAKFHGNDQLEIKPYTWDTHW
jgi:hypothetical protein